MSRAINDTVGRGVNTSVLELAIFLLLTRERDEDDGDEFERARGGAAVRAPVQEPRAQRRQRQHAAQERQHLERLRRAPVSCKQQTCMRSDTVRGGSMAPLTGQRPLLTPGKDEENLTWRKLQQPHLDLS